MAVDALVIGAGPAGSAVARLLARAGWSVALVEKARFPRRKVCGEFISATTFPALEACGVADEFIARAGPPVTHVAFYAGDASPQAMLPRAKSGGGWGRALGREHLDLLLRDSAVAAGAKLLQPADVVGMRPTANGHAVTLRQGEVMEEITARTVIAATGSWNAKGPFAITRPAKPSDLLAFKAHFQGAALPQGLMPLIAFPGGYGGMVHSDSGRISLSCCIRRDRLARVRPGGRAADAVLQHILDCTAGVRSALQRAVPEDAYLSAGPIRPGIRIRYSDGVFFTGNIAGEAHPVIAEGISMAIQSSWLLAKLLIAAGPVAGPAYSRAWEKQFATRIWAASLFAHCAMQDEMRGLAAGIAEFFPRILFWGATLSGKTSALPSV